MIRMPNGVMDWLEAGKDSPVLAAETLTAEAASRQGDPRSFEAAREYLERADRPSSVRCHGKPIMTLIAEALGEDDSREQEQ